MNYFMMLQQQEQELGHQLLDDIAPVDSANSEEVNHDEIECSDRLEKIPPRRKQLKKANRKRSISSNLTKQLDELCEAVKNKDLYIHINPPSCSVQKFVLVFVCYFGLIMSSSDSDDDTNE
ncbi:hypothetical protein CUMW_270490 [Citrus unshiu]|uniref:Uncharacterized protein n=1 Tax=Citrus unshiu TaxID=55188 RepID=A0A2H5QXA4_CITUN|nr:hypothetical protein CUMW_270490 [Citrus unshiu]